MIIKIFKTILCAMIVWFLYSQYPINDYIYNYILLLVFFILLRITGVFKPSGDDAGILNNHDFFD